jgi:hypothetical protein
MPSSRSPRGDRKPGPRADTASGGGVSQAPGAPPRSAVTVAAPEARPPAPHDPRDNTQRRGWPVG